MGKLSTNFKLVSYRTSLLWEDFMKILNFIKNNLLSNYFIIDAYDCFGNKVNHKIARNFLEKEITLFIWLNKYHYVQVI